MNRKAFVLILATAYSLSGCGHWGPAAYEKNARKHVDSQLSEGMSFDDFEHNFPGAKMLEGEVGNGAFFISVDDACFRCTNSDTFKRSIDSYARVVHFENGRLTNIEAVSGGGAR